MARATCLLKVSILRLQAQAPGNGHKEYDLAAPLTAKINGKWKNSWEYHVSVSNYNSPEKNTIVPYTKAFVHRKDHLS